MNASLHRQLNRRKRRITRRIRNQPGVERHQPMMTASNIRYEIAERTRAIASGGIGAIHLMAQRLGLVHDIDENLHLLKRHLPYHESDHVLNIADKLLAGGSRLEYLEVRRNDEVYLDALGATRIPDPTTAGDFCRRVTLRGDTDFTQTKHLDRWDEDGVRFVFGADARANLINLAERLSAGAHSLLERPPRYAIRTVPRAARRTTGRRSSWPASSRRSARSARSSPSSSTAR